MSIDWRGLPADWALSPELVDLWRAALDHPPTTLAAMSRVLSDDERRRAGRFRFEVERNRYVACRSILRTILGRYVNANAGELRFVYGLQGGPELDEPLSRSSIRFNVSHSHDLALLAFTVARSVGVDVECIRPVPDAEQIATTLFPRAYGDLLRTVPTDQREALFFRFWTETEALHKATGEGLRGAERGDATVVEPALWRLKHLVPREGFVAGLAVEGHDWELRCFQWDAGIDA